MNDSKILNKINKNTYYQNNIKEMIDFDIYNQTF
jgi:hypothetical protein